MEWNGMQFQHLVLSLSLCVFFGVFLFSGDARVLVMMMRDVSKKRRRRRNSWIEKIVDGRWQLVFVCLFFCVKVVLHLPQPCRHGVCGSFIGRKTKLAFFSFSFLRRITIHPIVRMVPYIGFGSRVPDRSKSNLAPIHAPNTHIPRLQSAASLGRVASRRVASRRVSFRSVPFVVGSFVGSFHLVSAGRIVGTRSSWCLSGKIDSNDSISFRSCTGRNYFGAKSIDRPTDRRTRGTF